jgi:hypothetical protein
VTVVEARSFPGYPDFWVTLFAEVPRAAFIPDTIWVDDSRSEALVALSKHTDPDGGTTKAIRPSIGSASTAAPGSSGSDSTNLITRSVL